MSIVGDVTGLGSVANLANNVLDKIFPDKTQADAAKAALAQAAQAGQLQEIQDQFDAEKAQIAVNQAEASNSNWFASNWRPFTGWISGFALAYVSVIEPLGEYIARVGLKYTGQFPVIDTTVTMQVLFGMLGLGAMRSFEKYNGVAGPTAGHG